MIKCGVNGMKELTNLLNRVEDSYFDFVYAMLNYAKKREDRRNALVGYLKEHPDAQIKTVQVLAGDPVAYPLHIGEEYQPLVDAINGVLEQARQDGRLAEISMKYFGVDMTKTE